MLYADLSFRVFPKFSMTAEPIPFPSPNFKARENILVAVLSKDVQNKFASFSLGHSLDLKSFVFINVNDFGIPLCPWFSLRFISLSRSPPPPPLFPVI